MRCVQARQLPRTDRLAGLAIRWAATGPGDGLLPVLDADLRLAPRVALSTSPHDEGGVPDLANRGVELAEGPHDRVPRGLR
jgi:hypothetical protein